MDFEGFNTCMEQWRAVPGFEGFYQVSNLGRVRSLARRCTVKQVNRKGHIGDEHWFRCSKILKPVNKRRPRVHLHDCVNVRHDFQVKVLVATAFLNEGKFVSARQVKFKDGNSANCHADNLMIKY